MLADDLVTVAEFGNPQQASFAKWLLEREGVHAYVSGAESTNMLWIVGPALGGVKLQVAEHDAEKSARILETAKHSEEATETVGPWKCTHCGETVDAGFETCWSCGACYAEAADTASAPVADTPEEDENVWETVETPPLTADEMALRAFRSSMYGMAFFPSVFGFLPFLYYSISLRDRRQPHQRPHVSRPRALYETLDGAAQRSTGKSPGGSFMSRVVIGPFCIRANL